MINHVRTLLLNLPAVRETGGGEEYVQPDFVPRKLSGNILFAHKILFGSAASREFANARVHQLLQLIHASRLEPHIYHSDSRVTYLPLLDDYTNQPTVVVTPSAGSPNLRVVGVPTPDIVKGRLSIAWRVEVLEESILATRLDTGDQTPATDAGVVQLGNGLVAYAPIAISPGMSWSVRAVAGDLTDAATILPTFVQAAWQSLLEVDMSVEPAKSQRNVLLAGNADPDMYAASLLLFANCIDRQPRG